MSSTQSGSASAIEASGAAALPMRFEVAVLPVADADRAKAFYAGLDWRLDADLTVDEHYRVVQVTPPGSAACCRRSRSGFRGGSTDGRRRSRRPAARHIRASRRV
jgi:catechol 2,3-dioxygenase-like lactoylglutathione lyase family enzyme